MKYRVYILFTLVLFALQLFAQQPECGFKIDGEVLDSLTRQAIAGATVRIELAGRSSLSDEHGHFNFNRLCAGKLIVTATAIGYKPYRKELSLSSNLELSFQLQAANLRLQEVEVKARKPVAPGANAAATLTQQQLEQNRGGTLADVLKTVPGVSSLQTGSTIAKPVIQGLHSNRLLILNNGIRLEGQQWGMEHAPEIDPFAAQSITVIKGAESVRFGPEAIGGVILVRPAALSKQRGIRGELNLTGSSNGSAGAVSGRVEGGIASVPGLAWRLQGTGKTSGNIKTAEYYLNNTATREANFSGALGYSRKNFETDLYLSRFQTELGIYSGSHIGNVDDVLASIANGRPFIEGDFSYSIDAPSQKVIHDLLKLESHFHLNNASHIDLIYGLQQNKRQEYDLRRGGRSIIPTLDLALTTQTLDLMFETDNRKGLKQTIGASGLLQVNNNIPGTAVTPLIPNYDSYAGGLYYIGKLLKNNYQLEAGVRYDHKYLDALGYDKELNLYGGTRRFNNVSANLGGVLYLSNQWVFRSNLATAWRPPAVSELYSNGIHRGSAAMEIGDDRLESEKSYKWISSVEFNGDKLSFDLSAFLNHIDNYIYLEPSGKIYEGIRGDFSTFYYQQTNARLSGADLGLRYQLSSKLAYELKAAVVRAKNSNTRDYLPWIPSDRLENSFTYRFARRSEVGGSYLSLHHLFVARQNRYQEGSDFAAPPPGYHLFGLGAGTEITVGKSRIGLNASLSNLSNVLYKDYMNRFRYYTHDQGRNLTVRAILKF